VNSSTQKNPGDRDSTSCDPNRHVTIIGAGIGGLVLALELHRIGVTSTIYEAAQQFRPLGVGINLLPHATRILSQLGLEEALTAVAVTTKEAVFYNRFGQLIHAEPAGRAAGYDFPQYSVHRSDLQNVLVAAVRERLGDDAIIMDHRCVSVEQNDESATVHFVRTSDRSALPSQVAGAVIACDGVHSAVRKQFYPDEGEPRYSGVMMWRGVTVSPPFLSGASMARVGWLASGKMVIYPIRDGIDAAGNQLVNWVAEVETPQREQQDWTRAGKLVDFFDTFHDWTFDWLDIAALIKGADSILEYPMVDRDPLPRWTFQRVTLLGDAAHPMIPRGSNGAGQAILDANRLAALIGASSGLEQGLADYEAERLPLTSAVVLANRTSSPDTIIREVWERTGDQPFDRVEDVISIDEINAISHRYQNVAGYSPQALLAAGENEYTVT